MTSIYQEKLSFLYFWTMSSISEKTLTNWIHSNKLCVAYFKTQNCGVCQVMLPKIEQIVFELEIPLKVIELSNNLHLASSQMVLNVPVTKVFENGREVLKEGAYLDLNKLRTFLQQTIESQLLHE